MTTAAPYQPEIPRTCHDAPSIEPAVLDLLRSHAAENNWRPQERYAFERAAERIRAAFDDAENYDVNWMTGKRRTDSDDLQKNRKRWDSLPVRAECLRLRKLRGEALVAEASTLSDRMQRALTDTVKANARRIGKRDLDVAFPGAPEWWRPGMLNETEILGAIGFILRSHKPGSHLGAPSKEHYDALADAVVFAYASLSPRRPGVTRRVEIGADGEERSGDISGALVDFASRLAELCRYPIAEENRLREATVRWKINCEKSI
jgi:hypothetical protein